MPLLQTRRLLADAEEPETDWTNVAAEAIIEAMFATAAATKLEDTGGNEFAYDTHGNMTTMPGLSVMSWTSGERLGYSEGGARVWYQYDGGGTRVRKFSRPVSGTGTQKERVYLDGFEIYRAWNDAGVLQERTETLNLGGVLAERKTVESGAGGSQSPGYRFQLGNHQGSVTLEVDGAGKVISWEEYHP